MHELYEVKVSRTVLKGESGSNSTDLPDKKGKKTPIRTGTRKGIKIHACVSCEGFPLKIQISSGNEDYRQHFIEFMEGIKVKTNGKSRTRPLEVLADAAYDDADIRQYLSSRAIKSNIPINTRNSKRKKRGRPTLFDEEIYHYRDYRTILCIVEDGV